MAFSKPRDGIVTRHLFVGNSGPSVGQPEDSVRSQFEAFGEVTGVTCPEGRSHVFVSFATEESAADALQALEGAPCSACPRRLVIKHAALKEDKEVHHAAVFFRAGDTGVPGLRLLPDFVSAEEEEAMLSGVDSRVWDKLARRRVLHFGYAFEYVTRNVDLERPLGAMPIFLQAVTSRLEQDEDLMPGGLDQVTVNEYPAGVGLSAHIDTHSAFAGPILSLSLAGDTVMEFRRDGERRALLLPRRSLLVMAGEARYAWAHYIPHRKSDVVPRPPRRVSFTFRKVRRGKCECAFPEFCDSQASTLPPTRMAQRLGIEDGATAGSAARGVCGGRGENRGDGAAGAETQHEGRGATAAAPVDADLEQLEQLHVHQVYNSIAPHFSSTRVAIWPKVREFIEALPTGAVLVDAGCGNGKYFTVRQDIAVIASDRSTGLVEQAWRKMQPPDAQHSVRGADLAAGRCSPAADVYVADAMRLAIRAGSCDALVCVAVLHHVSSAERRVRMLAELMRVLRPGGRALVTVWAQEQQDAKKLAKWLPIGAQPGATDASPGSAECGGDYFVPWHLPFHRTEAAAVLRQAQGTAPGALAGSSGLPSGGEINHEKGSVMFKRYYHLFRQGEMTRLGQRVQGCTVVDEFFDASNWCLLLAKD
eukprot:jgi/Tetstr1/453536/TSEL_040504.t1